MALFLAAMFTFSAVGCGKDKAEQQDAAVEKNAADAEGSEKKKESAEKELLQKAVLSYPAVVEQCLGKRM